MSALPLPHAVPEAVGLATAGLARLGRVLRGEIERGRVPGAVALVARRGEIAYFESFGERDPASGAPMARDEHLSHLLDDQADCVGGRDDAVGGRTIPAQRSDWKIPA